MEKPTLEKVWEAQLNHFENDKTFQDSVVGWQGNHEEYHKELGKKMDTFMEQMTPLAELADTFRGINLLRKPSLWILAVVLGGVALLGGVKALWITFIGLMSK